MERCIKKKKKKKKKYHGMIKRDLDVLGTLSILSALQPLLYESGCVALVELNSRGRRGWCHFESLPFVIGGSSTLQTYGELFWKEVSQSFGLCVTSVVGLCVTSVVGPLEIFLGLSPTLYIEERVSEGGELCFFL
jgi:hypothetical protein